MRLFRSLFSRTGITPNHFTPTTAAFRDLIAPAELPDARALPRVSEDALPAPLPSQNPAAPADAGARRPSAIGLAAKRGFDVAAALSMLAMLAPLLAVFALLVKRDGGPCVFGHTRIGTGGKPFKCLKFRSMVVDADAALKHLLDTDPAARAEWARDFKLKRDVRVTPIGRFMRKTSIDELPQLWNVVRGDMSLVGPRPVVEKELERYGADAAYYLEARPGITGLWQVSGRNDTDYATRVALDVAYVRNWSFGRDMVILVRTVRVVLRGSGAY